MYDTFSSVRASKYYCKIAEYRHSSLGNLGLNKYINVLKQRYRVKYTHTNIVLGSVRTVGISAASRGVGYMELPGTVLG